MKCDPRVCNLIVWMLMLNMLLVITVYGQRPPTDMDKTGGLCSEKAQREGDVWPLFAWLEIEYVSARALPRGATVADVTQAMTTIDRSKEWRLTDYHKLIVHASGGRTVNLSEVANVDVWLVRRDAKSASVSGLFEAEDKKEWRPRECLEARLELDWDSKQLSQGGVTRESVLRAIGELSPDREYSLEDIRNADVPGTDGKTLRVGQLAKVNVILREVPEVGVIEVEIPKGGPRDPAYDVVFTVHEIDIVDAHAQVICSGRLTVSAKDEHVGTALENGLVIGARIIRARLFASLEYDGERQQLELWLDESDSKKLVVRSRGGGRLTVFGVYAKPVRPENSVQPGTKAE